MKIAPCRNDRRRPHAAPPPSARARGVAAALVLLVAMPPGIVVAGGGEGAATGDAPAALDPWRPVALTFERAIGESGTGPGQFHGPGGLAATAVGGILVADTGNARVQHLDARGDWTWEAGGIGTDEGALRRPTAVATATGLTFLVLDSLARQVLEFHARGEYLGVGIDLAAGELGARLDEIEPRGMAVDEAGNTILSDRDGDRLLVFSPSRELLYEIGGFGADAQSFEDPEGVAVARNRIFVADSMNGRIQVLDGLGRFLHAWTLPGGGRPVGAAVDRHGNVFVADAGEHRVVAYGRDGAVACQVGARGRGPGSFRRPAGVCVVGDRLVVADTDNDRLQVFRIRYAGPAGAAAAGAEDQG